MAEMPTGIVTFLFTDIEGSTHFWGRQPDSMRRLLDHHNSILAASIDRHRGHVFKEWGDQFCAAFADARDAAGAAAEAQSALHEEVPQVRVRMALHTGAAELIKADYFGQALSHAARLLDAGHGGQVLVSRATAEQLQLEVPADTRLHFLGTHRLRDIPASETIFHLRIEGLPNDFPPLNTLDVVFRRGVKRAAAVSAVVLAVMAGLLARSLHEQHRADRNAGLAHRSARAVSRMLALNQTDQGVKKLEAGNGLGLLDLIEARRTAEAGGTAEALPDLKEAIGTVWAGWHQALAGRLINAVGHDGAILDLKFSPDGTRLATASEDKTARLWDTRTWEPVGRPLRHGSAVRHVAFSPDGKLLATVDDRAIRLWNAATGEGRGRPLRHAAVIDSVAFSADGRLLASGCWDGTVRLWDTETGRPRGRPLRPDGSAARVGFREGEVLAGFAPSPEKLLVVATDRSISLWNPATGEPLGRLLRRVRPSSVAPALAFGPDGAVRAIASDRTVWLWDAAERRFRGDRIRDPGSVDALVLSPDGRLLATGGWSEPVVQLWETASGKRSVPLLLHSARVQALAFGPVGSKFLVTRSWDGAVRYWDTSTGQPPADPAPSEAGAGILALSPDGRTLATTAANGTVHLWAVHVPPAYERLPLPRGTECIASIDGGAVFVTYSDDGLRLWSAETGQLLSRYSGPGRQPAGAFSQDGEFLIEWGDRSVMVWETHTGRLHGPLLRLPGPVLYATVSRHAAVLATVSPPNRVQLWDAASKRPRGASLRSRTTEGPLEFSPDERLLVTAEGSSVDVWDTATGQLHLPPIGLAGRAEWTAFSPDSRLLAIAGRDGGSVTIRSTAAGRQLLRRLEHPAHVYRGVFAVDGRLLATVTEENLVYLWDLANGRLSGTPISHGDPVLDLRFSPDGKMLAATSKSGVRLWDGVTHQPVTRPLLATEPVEARFGLGGRVLALRAGRAHGQLYLWRMPAAPAGLPELERLTAIALGVRPVPGGGSEALSWLEWRHRRDDSRRPE